VPEQLLGGVLLGHGTHRDLDERPVVARALVMDVPCKGRLAGARLATDQDPAVVLRDPARLFAQPVHHRRLADRLHHRLDMAAQIDVFALQSFILEGTLDCQQQLGQRDGLLDEIVGTQPGRLHRGFHSAVSGHHDNGAGQVAALGPLAQQGDAVHILHPDIEQDQVRTPRPARLACGFAVFGRGYRVTLVLEDVLHEVADIRLVIDDEDVTTGHLIASTGVLVRAGTASRMQTQRL
jgi:hypothetical protein